MIRTTLVEHTTQQCRSVTSQLQEMNKYSISGQSSIKFIFCLQALLVSALVAVAAAAPAGPLVAAPGYAAPDLAEPPVYTYQYGVNDDYSGANFQQTESRDGYGPSKETRKSGSSLNNIE